MSNASHPSPPGQQIAGMDVLRTGVTALAGAFAGALLITLIVGIPGGEQGRPGEGMIIALMAVTSLALLGAVYWMMVRFRGLGWDQIGFRPIERPWIVRAVGIGVACVVGIGIVGSVLNRALGLDEGPSQGEMIAGIEFSLLGSLTLLAYGAVIAPIAEEAFFRGILYGWLRRKIGVWPGIAASALVFSILHGVVSAFIPILLMGVVLAYLFERTGSLWPSVIVHQVFNGISLIFMLAMS